MGGQRRARGCRCRAGAQVTTLTVPARADRLTAGCHCHLLPAPAAQCPAVGHPAPCPAPCARPWHPASPGEASGTRGAGPGWPGRLGQFGAGAWRTPAHPRLPRHRRSRPAPGAPLARRWLQRVLVPVPVLHPAPDRAGWQEGTTGWPEGTVVRGAQRHSVPSLGRAAGGSAAGTDQRDNLLLSVDISVAVPRGGSCSMP